MAMAQFSHPGGMPGHGGMPHGHPVGPGHPQGMPGGQAGINQVQQMMASGSVGPQVSQAGMMPGMPQNVLGMNMQALASQQGLHPGLMQNQAMMTPAQQQQQQHQMLMARQRQQQMAFLQQQQQQAAAQGNPNMMMMPGAQGMYMINGVQAQGMPRTMSMGGHSQSPMPQPGHGPGHPMPQQQIIMQQQQANIAAAQQAALEQRIQQQQQQQQQQQAAQQQQAQQVHQQQQQQQAQQTQQQQQQQAHQQQNQQQIAMQQQASQSGPSPAPSAMAQPPMRPPSQVQNRPEQQDAHSNSAQAPTPQPTSILQPQPPPPQSQPNQQPGQNHTVGPQSGPSQPQSQNQNQSQSQNQAQAQAQAQHLANQQAHVQAQAQNAAQQADFQRRAQAAQMQAIIQRSNNSIMAPTQGLGVLTLLHFADRLSVAGTDKLGDELSYWQVFVNRFFSSSGQFRQHLLSSTKGGQYKKGFTVGQTSLPWYFYLLFRQGISRIDINMQHASEDDLPPPHGGHLVKSQRTSFTYWYGSTHQVVLTGKLQVLFDAQYRIQLFDYDVDENKEYLDRSELVDNTPEATGSPNQSKNSKKAMQQRVANIAKHPGLIAALERRPVGEFAFGDKIMVFFEMADNFGLMSQLIEYSAQNQSLSPQEALRQVTTNLNQQSAQMNSEQANHMVNPAGVGHHMGFPGMPPNQRTPGGGPTTAYASPAPGAHLALPGSINASPMIGHGMPGGPPGQGGVAMMQVPSQGGGGGGGSGNPSATASPSVAQQQQGKKRRASQVKMEEGPDGGGQGSGGDPKVKPSPRVGGKRMKPQ